MSYATTAASDRQSPGTRRVTHHDPCPTCGRSDWCRVARDNTYAICNRRESDRPATGAGGGWVHRLTPGAARHRAPIIIPIRVAGAASEARLDAAYRRLLARCPLSDQHRADLIRRGIAHERIAGGYGTLPLKGRSSICRAMEAAGIDLAGIPGFTIKTGDHGDYWTLAGSPGLLIACRPPSRLIRGLRIKPDGPTAAGKGGKYRWFSSAEMPGGTASGAHCHVAIPASDSDPATIWVTEGEIKSEIAADRLGAKIISIPGVGIWPKALADVAELLPDGGRVVVAMDADWATNPAVLSAVWGLVRASRALGYRAEVASWANPFKGLDDALAGGVRPKVSTPDGLPDLDWKLKWQSRILCPCPKRPTPRPITLAAMRARIGGEIRGLARCT